MGERSKSDAVKDFARQVVDGAGTAVTLTKEATGQAMGIGTETAAKAADMAKTVTGTAVETTEEYFQRIKSLAVDMGSAVLAPLVEVAAKLKDDPDSSERWIDGQPALGDRPTDPTKN